MDATQATQLSEAHAMLKALTTEVAKLRTDVNYVIKKIGGTAEGPSLARRLKAVQDVVAPTTPAEGE